MSREHAIRSLWHREACAMVGSESSCFPGSEFGGDPACPGWHVNPDKEAVERCDDCARFCDDLSARAHVRRAIRRSRAAPCT